MLIKPLNEPPMASNIWIYLKNYIKKKKKNMLGVLRSLCKIFPEFRQKPKKG